MTRMMKEVRLKIKGEREEEEEDEDEQRDRVVCVREQVVPPPGMCDLLAI